jgi:acetyl-CoA C-acetyltransferase
VNLASNQVKGGAGSGYIAGGVEMMSKVPMGSDGAAIAVDPQLAMTTNFVPQGISADLMATKFGFSRDDVDAYAVESQRRAKEAWKDERFSRSVVAINDQNNLTILNVDEYMRPETTMQSLGGLEPSFKMMGEVMPGFDQIALLKYPQFEKINHVHHAGNSSGIVDGASCVLIGNKEFGKENNLKPRAKVVATSKIGTDPTIMLTGPIPASEKILRTAKMSVTRIRVGLWLNIVLIAISNIGEDKSFADDFVCMGYCTCEIRFAHQEVHRIKIDARAPDGKSTLLKFNQKLYWAE